VTDFLKLKRDRYRPQIFVSAAVEAAPDDWRRALLQSRRALIQRRPRPNNDARSIANAAVQNQKSESTGSDTRGRRDFLASDRGSSKTRLSYFEQTARYCRYKRLVVKSIE
jgi:hypothetical protein